MSRKKKKKLRLADSSALPTGGKSTSPLPSGSTSPSPPFPGEQAIRAGESSIRAVVPRYPDDSIPLSHWSKAMDYWGTQDARDLAALLAYGPPHIPYTYGWTDNRVEQVRHFKQWVFVAIDKIATRVASQMPNVSWVEGDEDSLDLSPSDQLRATKNKLYAERDRRRALTPLLTHERLQQVPTQHPLKRLLRSPNNQDSSWDLWYETMLFLLLTGSAYWWLPPGPIPSAIPGRNLPAAIWVVPSHWMWPIIGKQKIIEAWEIRPVEGNYLRRRLPVEQIVHFRRKNPISKLDGFSPLTACNQWVDVQESISKAAWWSYKNGPMPNVAISFDGSMNDPTDEELRRIEAKFLVRRSGENNAGKPIWTPPGVKLTPLTIEPHKMVFGPNAREQAHNILCTYGIPPGCVFLEGNTLEDEAAFLSMTINPWCRFMGWTVTDQVGKYYPKSRNGGEVRVWWEGFRVDDPKQTNDDIRVDLLCGGITPSEERILRGREPWTGDYEEWGNKPIIPVNMEPGALPGGGAHESGDNNDIPSPKQPAINPEDSKAYNKKVCHSCKTEGYGLEGEACWQCGEPS